MNKVKNKQAPTWTEDLSYNFNTLKQMFVAAPLDFAPEAKFFIFTIDFSKHAVGAVFSQEQKEAERFQGVKG